MLIIDERLRFGPLKRGPGGLLALVGAKLFKGGGLWLFGKSAKM